MPNKRILKNSTVLLVLIIFSALAWGDQKKTSAPSRPAPQVKAAPAPKSTPSRPAPGLNRTNTGVVNRPTIGAGSHGPTTGGLGSHGPTTGGAVSHGPTTGGLGSHGPTTGGLGSHGPTTGGAVSHGPTTGGLGSHGPTTGGLGSHGPTTGGAVSHGPTTGGLGSHGPTTGGLGSHGPTTGGLGSHGPTTGGAVSHGPTTGGLGSHGPTTGGLGSHGPTTGGAVSHGPTTGMGNRPTPGVGTNLGARGGMAHPGPRTTTRTFTDHSGHPASATFRPGGHVATIHANGMTINHGLRGGRTIVAERNGRTIVSTGRQGGYVQRPYISRGGRAYYQRTYVVGGRSYARVYRGYDYRGVRYYGYAPGYYYHPRFYGWAYNPWVRPVYYGPAAWGWAGTPWFGFYGGFFTPYPVYASASLWLTDYLIAANLQAAYQARLDAYAAAGGGAGQAPADESGEQPYGGPAASSQTPLSPEVKQAIADEVQRQLAAENAAAANPQAAPSNDQVPDALNPAERVFVVASNLDVTAPDSGQQCSLTPGDVVMRLSDTPDDNQNVTASVQSSKKGDCPTGQTVAIGVQDLQEMHNQFRAQLDSGLKTLADKGGTGGLPKPPDTGTTNGEVPPPAPDSAAADQLQAQQQQADQTEAQAAQNYQ